MLKFLYRIRIDTSGANLGKFCIVSDSVYTGFASEVGWEIQRLGAKKRDIDQNLSQSY